MWMDLAAAVIVERAVNAMGGNPHVVPARRGEHVHHPNMKGRIVALDARASGRARHGVAATGHFPGSLRSHGPSSRRRGTAAGSVVVNGYDRSRWPHERAGLYRVRIVAGNREQCMGRGLGAVADLGYRRAVSNAVSGRAGDAKWSRAAALLNAARRAENRIQASRWTRCDMPRRWTTSRPDACRKRSLGDTRLRCAAK